VNNAFIWVTPGHFNDKDKKCCQYSAACRELALVRSGLAKSQRDLGPAGYIAGYALVAGNLRLGLSVTPSPPGSRSPKTKKQPARDPGQSVLNTMKMP